MPLLSWILSPELPNGTIACVAARRKSHNILSVMNEIATAIVKPQVNACGDSGKEGMYGKLAMVERSTG
jgi:hypothetical protein